MQTNEAGRFNERIVVCCPSHLAELIEKAARQNLNNRSQYVRTAILRQIEADGLRPEAV
jgi:metal-responsive CopG/Arc/MetJ family transcriptional regulator